MSAWARLRICVLTSIVGLAFGTNARGFAAGEEPSVKLGRYSFAEGWIYVGDDDKPLNSGTITIRSSDDDASNGEMLIAVKEKDEDDPIPDKGYIRASLGRMKSGTSIDVPGWNKQCRGRAFKLEYFDPDANIKYELPNRKPLPTWIFVSDEPGAFSGGRVGSDEFGIAYWGKYKNGGRKNTYIQGFGADRGKEF